MASTHHLPAGQPSQWAALGMIDRQWPGVLRPCWSVLCVVCGSPQVPLLDFSPSFLGIEVVLVTQNEKGSDEQSGPQYRAQTPAAPGDALKTTSTPLSRASWFCPGQSQADSLLQSPLLSGADPLEGGHCVLRSLDRAGSLLPPSVSRCLGCQRRPLQIRVQRVLSPGRHRTPRKVRRAWGP